MESGHPRQQGQDGLHQILQRHSGADGDPELTWNIWNMEITTTVHLPVAPRAPLMPNTNGPSWRAHNRDALRRLTVVCVGHTQLQVVATFSGEPARS